MDDDSARADLLGTIAAEDGAKSVGPRAEVGLKSSCVEAALTELWNGMLGEKPLWQVPAVKVRWMTKLPGWCALVLEVDGASRVDHVADSHALEASGSGGAGSGVCTKRRGCLSYRQLDRALYSGEG